MRHKEGIRQVYFLAGIEDLEYQILIEMLTEECRKATSILPIFTV
ncbi:MAG: hypothetical protein NDF55_05130 [archaeon GB-1867-005]|nr:hypothetical protein [Candidatus Culexmicrobium cathedralense]